MGEKKFTPIIILWIEDNPLQNSLTGKLVNERNGYEVFDKSFYETPIPVIYFEGDLKNDFKYFDLKILQHPEEIKEYITMCLHIEDNEGPKALGSVPGIVPEVIVFDYKLSENIEINRDNKNIKYRNPNEATRKYVNPNFLLQEKFKEQLAQIKLHLEDGDLNEYSLGDFIKRINDNQELDSQVLAKDTIELAEDDLGLYSGIEITRLYRNYPCVGVPATFNKADKDRLHAFSKYYEWLNEYDLGSMFSRSERGSKEWESVIKDGTYQLRQRIKVLIQSLKIVPSLSQLIELAGGDIPERIFSYVSIYGERVLPLDGLFIDVAKDKRIKAISEFAKECLNLNLKNANAGLTKDVLDSAIKFCNDLLEQYDRKDKFLERIRFSQLIQKGKNGILTRVQQIELDAIYTKHGMTKSDTEYKDSFDLRDYKGANSNLVKRYSALFAMVNLYHRFVKFKKNNAGKREYEGKPYLFTQPEKMDYLLVLYPRPADPLVIPLHGKSDGHDNDLKRTTKRITTDDAGILINSVLYNMEKNGITKGERILLQSYASGIGLAKEDFAEWFN